MSAESSPTLEDRLAERLVRVGLLASIGALLVLSAILLGNVLVRLLAVAVNAVLLLVINQGPALAAILGGISTAATYYGWSRILRRRDRLNLREEAKGQAMDQAGNLLQKLAGFGCASRLALSVFGVALICCLFTYVPSPLHIFGVNGPARLQSSPTATSVSAAFATPTPAPRPTSTPRVQPPPLPTTTPLPAPTVTPLPAPTATPLPAPTATPTLTPPGKLDVLTPTVALTSYCNSNFTGAVFSFTNAGGTPIYWTVRMPRGYSLATGYPTTGTLQPFQGDTQNEYFQGIANYAAITIAWGFTPTNAPYTGTVMTSCKNIT